MTTHWFEIIGEGAETVERGESVAGTPLSDLLRDRGYELAFDCGGRGRCGRCRVRIEGPASDSSLSIGREVLACQTRLVASGLRIDATRLSRGAGLALVGAETRRSRATRLQASDLTESERLGGWGVAIDLGTTTLESAFVSQSSGRVYRMEARRNAQASFGGDVVSRIAHCAADASNVEKLRRLATRGIESMIESGVAALSIKAEQVEELVVAGNTTMELLLLGVDPTPLGRAPFHVAERRFSSRSWGEVEVGSSFSHARLRVFPVFSAFVGGDVLAGYAVLRRRGAFVRGRTVLFLDVGTNGESILWRDGRAYATSTAAGPAFEGADISQGTTATPGAIYRIDADASSGRWEARTLGDLSARGVCGSGLVDALAACLDFGLIGANGRVASSAVRARGEAGIAARLVGSGRDRAVTISNALEGEGVVRLTQRDVRQAQLAIGAVKTGRRFLLEAGDARERDLDAAFLAGGFGGALQIDNARRIGLLPGEVASSRVAYLGNASLEGAIGALRGEIDWRELAEAIDQVEIVNLATRENFAEVFAKSTIFPE